ncbi:MAG TPA: MATE family efflux transporter, partial [Candidatus Rifleibacterium sp.]|nr:MATE family efflux transporter [Candidatus Rifleibacterium sp.]
KTRHMKQTRDLEQLPISKLLIRFAVPAMTGTLITSLYNIVDRIFLGRYVGELGIAATTIAMPLMMIVMAIGMLIGFGTNSQISIRLGEKRHDEAEKLLGQGFFLLVTSSIIFSTLSLLFMDQLLIMFGATEKVLPYARTYLSIVVIGTITHQISFAANSFIRGEGNPRVAMATMLIGGIINVILDYLFIGVFGWGMAGAAWATVIGYSVSSLWVLHYFLSGKSVLKLRRENFRIRPEMIGSVMMMGSPSFIMNTIASVQMSLFNNQLAKFGGDTAISVMGVIMSFNMVWMMPVIGISQGMQPIVGYNFGARRFDRVKKALFLANAAATVMSIACFIFIEIFPGHVFRLFISDGGSNVIGVGIDAIRRFMLLLPLVGYLIITGNYFQFTGRPKISLALTIIRQVGFLIPALLILPDYFGLNGVWYAMPTSDAGAFLITTFFFFRELRNLARRIAEKPASEIDAPDDVHENKQRSEE